MKIKKLSLTNFRSHKSKELELKDDFNIIVGSNGSGKTNILEAIYLLSIGKSFRASRERDLISFDTLRVPNLDSISSKIVVSTSEGEVIDLLLVKNQSTKRIQKKFRLNGVQKPLNKGVGYIKSSIFAPEDIRLITGSPSRRRIYIDSLLSQVSEEYYSAITKYNKILKNRNKVLESISVEDYYSDKEKYRTKMQYWDTEIVSLGKIIQNKRKEYFEYSRDVLKKHSLKGFSGEYILKLNYEQSLINEFTLKGSFTKDILRSATQLGPHRDDYTFFLIKNSSNYNDDNTNNKLDTKTMASRGEQRSVILCLKVLEMDYIAKHTSMNPILLLDDIFSELDDIHRLAVIELIRDKQVIITSADERNIPDKIKQNAKRFDF